MRHPGALAFLGLFLSSVLAAQPPQPSAETLHVTSQMVVLDLVVTDSHGNVVTNCTPADFKVYEDGVLQHITHFEPPAPDRKLPLAASIDHNGRQDWGDTPLTMIVMDEMNTPFSEFAYTREEVNRFLKAQPALLPQPTMVLWLNDSGFHSLTPFSRDRESLLTAVARHSASLPSKLMRRDDVERLSESFAALQQIALSARGSSAAKKIIWIGRGFPGVDTEQLSAKDQETFNRAVHSTLDLLLAGRASVDVVDPTDLLGSNPEPVAVIGGDASDIVGLDDPATLAIASAPDPFAATFNFSNFARQTGGHYFYGHNDIDREIASSSARANSFYTLSYTPSQFIQDGKYRKIDIRMSNPNLTATTKMGYYPGGDDRSSPTRKELGFDLYEASVTGMVYTGVGLHLQHCERDPDMIHANCLLGIDSGSLTFVPDSDGSYRAQVITAVSSVDAKSRLLYWTVDRVTFRVPSSKVNRIATGSGNLTIRAVIAPQAKAVRFIVRDSSGRIGTADLPPQQIGSLSASIGVLQQLKRERRRR